MTLSNTTPLDAPDATNAAQAKPAKLVPQDPWSSMLSMMKPNHTRKLVRQLNVLPDTRPDPFDPNILIRVDK